MTSTHSHSSGKAEFRLGKEWGWQNAPSKTATLGFGSQGDSGDLWGFTASCVSGRRLAGRGQHPRLGDWKCEVKCQRLSSSNTYGFHSLLPPSCVGSGRYNHWAGPGKYQHDGKGYCHIHWCRCHILHLSRERNGTEAVSCTSGPVTHPFCGKAEIPGGARDQQQWSPMCCVCKVQNCPRMSEQSFRSLSEKQIWVLNCIKGIYFILCLISWIVLLFFLKLQKAKNSVYDFFFFPAKWSVWVCESGHFTIFWRVLRHSCVPGLSQFRKYTHFPGPWACPWGAWDAWESIRP